MTAAIYARVSTSDQDCSLQLSELKAYCKRAKWKAVEYVDRGVSGAAGKKRPQLERLMADARLRKVDCVLVWKIDRFGRSVQELIARILELDQVKVRFVAPSQGIDTDQSSPAGRLLMHILAAIAEFERELIAERVKAGVAEAKRKGKHCGRPKRIFRRDRVLKLRKKGMSWRKIAAKLKLPMSTIRGAACEN